MAQIIQIRSFKIRKKELKEARCIGFDSKNQPIWVDINTPMGLEEYLLRTKNNWRARFMIAFGFKYRIGNYKLPDEPNFSTYYLFRCLHHGVLYVSTLTNPSLGIGECPKCCEVDKNE